MQSCNNSLEKKSTGSDLVLNLFPFLGYKERVSIWVRRLGAPSHLFQGWRGFKWAPSW